MTDSPRLRLTVEFEPASEPIRGVVYEEPGTEERSFCGWLDLVALLQRTAVGGQNRELEGAQ